MDYEFDRFLRFAELSQWIDDIAAAHPRLVTVETYGTSYEGRPLRLLTITDTTTGPAESKPAHWIDASIHAVELTATVAACRVVARLLEGHAAGDVRIMRALATRTFYVVPRVNPDGAEWALADRPRLRRSSTRPWPRDDRRSPGLCAEDIDGDGRILEMRIADEHGPWMPHPDDARALVPVPLDGPPQGVTTYRVYSEGFIEGFDGFTVPRPRPPESLDLNRNFPAGWGRTVPGSGDHPLSEPEVDALVRAIAARPNICGYNAFHTAGGFLLRPSATQPDSQLPPDDVWVWKQLAERGTALTGYSAHSVFEDLTWDPNETQSGAADDWAYEHLGVYSWTTEFWDLVHAATGERIGTDFWFVGPTDEQVVAALRWVDAQPPPADQRDASFVDWYPFDHPQLGPVELGGWNDLRSWVNPPPHRLRAEVEGHAEFALTQALAAPCLELAHVGVDRITGGDNDAADADVWRIFVGVLNSGWLPTDVTALARRDAIVLPIEVELIGVAAADVLDGPTRRELGQLAGAVSARFEQGGGGSPERAMATFTVRAPRGTEIAIEARHQRAGRRSTTVTLLP
ncbi:MAG: M14 family metallopeptidase [Actinomycetota bacterium]